MVGEFKLVESADGSGMAIALVDEQPIGWIHRAELRRIITAVMRQHDLCWSGSNSRGELMVLFAAIDAIRDRVFAQCMEFLSENNLPPEAVPDQLKDARAHGRPIPRELQGMAEGVLPTPVDLGARFPDFPTVDDEFEPDPDGVETP